MVPLPETRLDALVRASGNARAKELAAFDPRERLFDLVRRQRGEELTAALLQDASVLGPLNFVDQRAIPLIERVGDAWAAGTIHIRQEHSFSERLGDVLRALRIPYERGSGGPLVLLATLPGERHGLGLQLAALVVALAGGRPDVLGTDTPPGEIAEAARVRRHDAVGISISSSSGGVDARRALTRLRHALPSSTLLFAGGRGAAPTGPAKGIEVTPDLASLHDWVRRAAARRRRS